MNKSINPVEISFELGRSSRSTSPVDLTTDEAGTVEVYFYSREVGQFLGCTTITSGATNVGEISLDLPFQGRLLVAMAIINQSVAPVGRTDAPPHWV